MTKIDIISGFLGAGKTTFIKKLLEEGLVGEKTVLIENEFGEVGIDGGFLKDSGMEIREMNSGCICCSLVGDFSVALREILSAYKPDRIIIEPSGVGKLSDVLKAVSEVEQSLEVSGNTALTMVDVNKCRMYMKNFGEFFNNQIAYAGVIVLSRTDIASPEKVEQVVALIRSQNPHAKIITTPIRQLSGERLLAIMETEIDLKEMLLEEVHANHAHEHSHHHHGEDCGCHHHDHSHGEHHHADDVFESWGREDILQMEEEGLRGLLNKLAYTDEFGAVLRAKGMVPVEGGRWIYFDLVPDEVRVIEGEPDYTGRICVIGSGLDGEQLEKEFRGAK